MKYFAENLKALRKSHGMTQAELAKMLGRQKSTVSNYERDYPPPPYETLQKLSEIFNVTVDELMNPPATLRENTIDDHNRIEIPMVSSKTGSNDNNSLSIPIEIMGSGNFFVMKLEDNALSASNLNEGDLVLFKHQRDVKNGDLAAVVLKDKTRLVRYIYRQDGKVTLVASEKIAPLVFSENEVTVLGKAEKALVSVDI